MAGHIAKEWASFREMAIDEELSAFLRDVNEGPSMKRGRCVQVQRKAGW